MKRTKIDSGLEKKFLTSMVTSKQFLISNIGLIDPEIYSAKYFKLIAGWCRDYFAEYNDAPGRVIESIFHAWVDKEQAEDEDTEAISDFLSSLSESYDESPDVNVPYLTSKHTEFVRNKRMSILAEKITGALSYGDYEQAAEVITAYREVPNTGMTGFDPMQGKEHYVSAFSQDRKCLIHHLPQDAIDFFGPTLTLGGFLALQGSAKRKKTFWLYEFAYRALLSGLRVAFFQVGDLTKDEQVMRWALRIAQHPIFLEDCAGVQVPVSLTLSKGPQGPVPEIIYSTKTFKTPLTIDMAWQAIRTFSFKNKISKSDSPSIMFDIHPMTTINVKGVDLILKRWRQELDFSPEIILIDYADILAPENPKLNKLDQVNETWQRLRRLSQEWNALVITPTQANKASYTVKTQSAMNVADNQLKLAHVTAMLGLSQTHEEISQGIMRLNWINRRSGRWDPTDTLWTAQCLPLGAAMLRAVRGFNRKAG